MKRTVCMLLAALLLLGLVSCAHLSGPAETEKESKPDPASTPTTAAQKSEPESKPETEAKPETEPEPETEPASTLPEKMAKMVGSYELDNYTNDSEAKYYRYDILRNLRIRTGVEPGTLTLNEDGTGRLSYLGNELSFEWNEEAFTIDGQEYPVRFSDPVLSLDLSEEESLSYRSVSHLEAFNHSQKWYEQRKVVDASAYALGEPEVVHFDEGSRNYVFVRIPIENKSGEQLVPYELYFTALSPDGRELGFFALAPSCTKLLLPGEQGDFVFNFFVTEEQLDFAGRASADVFPEDVVIRVEEVDAFVWTGEYRRYDAEITEVLTFVDPQTGGYMLHRPNGFIELPEGTDINGLEFYVYCYDKADKLVGFGAQFAVLSSINPVLFLEEIPGEHRARFQTNMIGPFEDLDFPQDSIDRYEIVAYSPGYYE